MTLARIALPALVSLAAIAAHPGFALAGGPTNVSAASRSAPPAVAGKGTAAAAQEPARRFARAVTRRARRGWQIRVMDVEVTEERSVLQITMATTRVARRLDLAFTADGDRVVGFRSEAAPVPREVRIYGVAGQLVEFLRRGELTEMEEVCGMFYLGGLDDGVAIDPIDYHVVESRSRGWGAPAALAMALSDALEAGLGLVTVDQVRAGDGGPVTGYDFAFAGEISRVVHADLDERGRVRAVEVRRVPFVAPWQRYRRGRQLLEDLGARTAIRTIAVAPDGDDEAGAVILDGALTIEPDDFEVGDSYCRC